MSPSEEKQKENKWFDNHQQYPKVPSGFECFVCGKKFGTDEERIQHLEKDAHGSMYDTASPQEREDTDFNNTQEIYLLKGSNAKWKE